MARARGSGRTADVAVKMTAQTTLSRRPGFDRRRFSSQNDSRFAARSNWQDDRIRERLATGSRIINYAYIPEDLEMYHFAEDQKCISQRGEHPS
jgi:hypothetical protein